MKEEGESKEEKEDRERWVGRGGNAGYKKIRGKQRREKGRKRRAEKDGEANWEVEGKMM